MMISYNPLWLIIGFFWGKFSQNPPFGPNYILAIIQKLHKDTQKYHSGTDCWIQGEQIKTSIVSELLKAPIRIQWVDFPFECIIPRKKVGYKVHN